MNDFDTIVIGSGAGGLTAALALARAGQRVLVLEQHYVPGGWCHSFTLEGYRFSPGVHYIGELAEGGRMRAIYEGLGVSDDLAFCELNPEGYDHILVGGERFDIPRGKERFAERLKTRFPAEARGIDGYLQTIDRLGKELGAFSGFRGWKDALTLPRRAPTLMKWGWRSTRALIEQHVGDPLLRAILAGQAGDHGLPPSLAPAPVHAAVVSHYFDGGFYPRGGAYTLPRAFVRALKKAGGQIRLGCPVERMLVEKGRVIGVRTRDGQTLRAGQVISNADPHVTYLKLLGEEHLGTVLRYRLRHARYSVSALSLFAAVDLDLRRAGLDSGNYWCYASSDIEGIYRQGMTAWDPLADDLAGLFVTVTTLKDPSKFHRGHHTLEAFTFLSHEAFSRWAESQYGGRPEGYQNLKEALKQRMLAAVERVIPGLRQHLVFSDLGTPLTNQHYVAATDGNLYGTEKGFSQVGPLAFPVRTEVPGLWMCGASTLGHGVMGATYSGLVAAAQILRAPLRELLSARGRPLPIYPSEQPELWPAEARPRRRPGAVAPADSSQPAHA